MQARRILFLQISFFIPSSPFILLLKSTGGRNRTDTFSNSSAAGMDATSIRILAALPLSYPGKLKSILHLQTERIKYSGSTANIVTRNLLSSLFLIRRSSLTTILFPLIKAIVPQRQSLWLASPLAQLGMYFTLSPFLKLFILMRLFLFLCNLH